MYCSPLVRVNNQRWLLSTLILRILSRLTRTLWMDPLKPGPAEALVDGLEGLSGHVALVPGPDPDDFTLGLKGEDFVEVQQIVVLTLPGRDLGHPPLPPGFGGAQGLSHPFHGFPPIAQSRLGALHRRPQAILADRLQQVVDRPDLKSVERVPAVGGHEDDGGQRPLELPEYLEVLPP